MHIYSFIEYKKITPKIPFEFDDKNRNPYLRAKPINSLDTGTSSAYLDNILIKSNLFRSTLSVFCILITYKYFIGNIN